MEKRQKKQKRAPARRIAIGLIFAAVLGAIGLFAYRQHAAPAAPITRASSVAVLGGKLVFNDVAAQSREFLGYYSSIRLNPQQEAIKKAVLEAMPAACCKDSTAYTCCCPCNLSKTVWGLSNYVLTRHRATADELRQVVRAWYDYTNPGGYSGDSCYTGACDRTFDHNGCGGMKESELAL